MFISRKSRKFTRVVLTIAVMLLTVGALARPQGSAQAVNYILTTCNASEFISVWNTAIGTTANDVINLRAECIYEFTAIASGTGDRAIANLPSLSTAGSITIEGNGSEFDSDVETGTGVGFLSMLANSNLVLRNVSLYDFDADYGAAIELLGGALSAYNSLFYLNRATETGGALWIDSGAVVYIDGTQFRANRATDGGAIRNYGGSVDIRRSSFYQNASTSSGGAISFTNNGTGTVSSSSFLQNNANVNGGAIDITPGSYTLRNLTIAENRADDDANNSGDGGGIYISGTFTTPLVIHNSAVATNLDASTSGTLVRDMGGVVDSGSGHNLIGVGTGLSGITNNVNSNRIGTSGSPINPLLGPLTTRDGVGYTYLYYRAPLANSPLINFGSNTLNINGIDARLYTRVIYTTVDVGSIEFKRPDSPVVVNPANQGWLFRYTNSAGPVELSFLYGQGLSDYQPIVGDWNGDDVDTQGVYTRFNASNIGVFALSNAFNSFDAATLPSFAYTDASPNWLPVAGDWDGNSADSVGAYRVTDGIWVLTNNNSSTTPSYSAFAFGGGAGILPLSGDWDGNGADSIGVYNFSNSRFILSNGIGSSASVNYNYVYGAAGYYPTVGDWDGDGIDTPGLYNPSTGQWLLRNTNTTGAANIAFVYGAGSNLIGRVGQWRVVTPGNGTSPIREAAVTPVVPAVTPEAPQIAPTFAP